MGFGLIITAGDNGAPLSKDAMKWIVEARVEMELSKPTRFALRFEDDECDGAPAMAETDELGENVKVGLFAKLASGELECLVYGPVTEVKSSTKLGGAGSWVEFHGSDRRIEMSRVGVNHTYTGHASAAAEGILSAFGFTPKVQQTLIVHDKRDLPLGQNTNDLAFLEEVARKNNMDLWISYAASRASAEAPVTVTETAHFETSPHREQSGGSTAAPSPPVLAPAPERSLSVNPGRRDCPKVTRFEAKIDYESPTSAEGFAMTDQGEVVQEIVDASEPSSLKEDPRPINGVERKAISNDAPTGEQGYLAREAIVIERSWFVEVQSTTTFDLAEFYLRPHQIITFTHAGARLSGAYQVMKTTHVVTASDHFMDFTARANGLGA